MRQGVVVPMPRENDSDVKYKESVTGRLVICGQFSRKAVSTHPRPAVTIPSIEIIEPMKKSLITLAVLGLGTAATAAQAQSSVTLYGLIDAGVTYVNSTKTANGGHSLIAEQDGATAGLSGSRWGMRGNEDLGGGLAAIFVLESGFSYNNGTSGQGGALFGRQAFVGLSSTQYGTF